MSKRPPQWMMRFFRWFCREDLVDAVEGDLLEVYCRNVETKGELRAGWRFFAQVVTFCQPFAIKKRTHRTTLNPFDMLRINIRLAFRNLLRTRFYSFMNILSLATGVAAVLLLMAFISMELSYDKMHSDGDRIYRFGYQLETENQPTRQLAWVSALVAPTAQSLYPEIEEVVRVRDCSGTMIGENNEFYLENNGFFAGAAFFNVFDFPVIAGDAEKALDEPNKLVLTRSMATKYFGTQNPIGKSLELRIGDTLDLQVSAVVEDLPDNVHFKFDYLISHQTREDLYPHIKGWFALGTHTYFKLADEVDIADFSAKAESMVMDVYGEEARSIGFTIKLFTQALHDIHLKSRLSNEIEANGDQQYVYIAAGIALIILLIAAFNFINLSVARSFRFIKQMGLRKVLGARKPQLLAQFVTDSLFSVLLSLVLALIVAYALLPYFNTLVARDLSISWSGWLSVSSLSALLILVALVAGAYPLMLIGRMKTTEAVKGNTIGGVRKNFTRQGLIMVQFGLATLLISAVLVIRGQLGFMMNSSLGFDHERVAVIELWNNRQARNNTGVLKSELLKMPGITGVTASNSIPGELLLNRVGYPDGDESLSKVMFSLMVQDDFLDLYQLDVSHGRDFSTDIVTDQTQAFLINQSAVEEFGWSPDEAIGRDFQWGSRAGKIIGVVKDFHYYSLQEKIPPMIILPTDGGVGYLSVKLNAEITSTVSAIENAWKSLYPDQVFNLFFLDDNFNQQYQLESQLDRIMGLFTIVAIMIACFGLFSLAAVHVDQRTKEIGIRKVLGASASVILVLIGRFFLRLVLISFVFALPMAYWLSQNWLEDFAFRMYLSPAIFLIAASVALLIAALTVFVQAFRTAITNPVKTLRYE